MGGLRGKAILEKIKVAAVPDLIWKLARMGTPPTDRPINGLVGGNDDVMPRRC